MRKSEPSFEAFVRARLPALLRYARTLTSPQDAEDLVQEALTRTGLAWWRVRRKDDPERYVRTVMVRLLINRWRRPVTELSVAVLPEVAGDDDGFAGVESALDLDRLFATLPPRMRAVLVLRYVDGLDDRAISLLLSCSEGTVRSQASRAVDKLRRTLSATEEAGRRVSGETSGAID